MKTTSQEVQAQIAKVKALMQKGFSMAKASDSVGINRGLALYHLRKEGFEVRLGGHNIKLYKKDKRILNANRAFEARYYLDSCQLHALGLRSGHAYRGSGLSLLAIVERPNRIVALKVIQGVSSANDWKDFFREVKLPIGSVLLSDVGNEFCKGLDKWLLPQGLTLVRLRGWIDGQQTKPWVESVFGEFQAQAWRPVFKEYLTSEGLPSEALPLEELFKQTCLLVQAFLKGKGEIEEPTRQLSEICIPQ